MFKMCLFGALRHALLFHSSDSRVSWFSYSGVSSQISRKSWNIFCRSSSLWMRAGYLLWGGSILNYFWLCWLSSIELQDSESLRSSLNMVTRCLNWAPMRLLTMGLCLIWSLVIYLLDIMMVWERLMITELNEICLDIFNFCIINLEKVLWL